MATTEEILDAIGSMTVLELSELKKAFEERFDVTAAAPAAVMAVGLTLASGWRLDQAIRVMRATRAIDIHFEQPCKSYAACRDAFRACGRPIASSASPTWRSTSTARVRPSTGSRSRTDRSNVRDMEPVSRYRRACRCACRRPSRIALRRRCLLRGEG